MNLSWDGFTATKRLAWNEPSVGDLLVLSLEIEAKGYKSNMARRVIVKPGELHSLVKAVMGCGALPFYAQTENHPMHFSGLPMSTSEVPADRWPESIVGYVECWNGSCEPFGLPSTP